MTNKYSVARIFRDGETRLVIPNLEITAINAVTNIASSFVTNPQRVKKGHWFRLNPDTSSDENPLEKAGNLISGIVDGLTDILTVGLGVTKIETSQDYVMPFSKGIGSTGEVIHLLGAKNEIINLQFTTDRYPGRMGSVLRGMLQKTLEIAQVVYLIDDLFLATPCLVRKIRMSKEANYRGAIMGSLELVSLSTGGNFISDKLGSFTKIKNTVSVLKSSVGLIGSSLGAVGVGAIAISGALVAGITGS